MPEDKENPMIQIVFIDSKGRAVQYVVHLNEPTDEVMWIDQSMRDPGGLPSTNLITFTILILNINRVPLSPESPFRVPRTGT